MILHSTAPLRRPAMRFCSRRYAARSPSCVPRFPFGASDSRR